MKRKRLIRTFLLIVVTLIVVLLITTRRVTIQDKDDTSRIILYNVLLSREWVKVYYKNGNLKESFRTKNKQKTGIFYQYYEEGRLKMCQSYENGLLNGLSEQYYSGGELMIKATFLSGKLEGRVLEFSEGGLVTNESTFRQGQREGDVIIYRDDGKVKARNKFYHDSLYYIKTYQYSDSGILRDSQEQILPLIEIKGRNRLGSIVSCKIHIMNEGLPFVRDSFYVRYDTGPISEGDSLYPYPTFYESFKGAQTIEHSFTIEEVNKTAALYGILEYHTVDGNIIELGDFLRPIPE